MSRTKCNIGDCDKPVLAKGMCNMHYKRVMRHGDPHHVEPRTPPSQKRHGASFRDGKATPEYNAWASMKKRCLNPNSHNFGDYGGRGISICDRWASNFEAFLADMGERPSKRHSLDRIDNNGDYTPENCRWADHIEQCNNKRSNRIVSLRGETLTLTEAARKFGKNIETVRTRISRGWSIEEALK